VFHDRLVSLTLGKMARRKKIEARTIRSCCWESLFIPVRPMPAERTSLPSAPAVP